MIKSEQEQIKAIKQIIDERVETNLGQVQGRHGNVIKTVDTVIIARDIIENGYGDVSEYKAEIERLKEVIEVFKNDTECNLNHITVENGQLKAKNKVLKDGIVKAFTNGFNEGRKHVEKDIRRAKIDVLNKVMTYINNKIENDYGDMSDSVNYITVDIEEFDDFIDELVKEVQNAEDKG